MEQPAQADLLLGNYNTTERQSGTKAPQGLTSVVVKAQHEVGNGRKQERLGQVVGHLDQALR